MRACPRRWNDSTRRSFCSGATLANTSVAMVTAASAASKRRHTSGAGSVAVFVGDLGVA